jgi:hypothetical protein
MELVDFLFCMSVTMEELSSIPSAVTLKSQGKKVENKLGIYHPKYN